MKPLQMAAAIVAGLVGTLAIDFFPVPALVAVTLLLIIGITQRAPVVVLACAISCGLILALWTLATVRCDQTVQNCAISPSGVILLSWLTAGLAVGATATLILVARLRPR